MQQMVPALTWSVESAAAQEVASATGTIVFLDSQYKPQKVPAHLKEVLIRVQQQREQQ
jgi:hypothetical protein